MSRQLSWGVLSVAKIGVEQVIPAMQRGEVARIDAIASRDLTRAKSAAAALGIAKAYGSYEALLADPAIEAIYNPLPNELHVEWTIRALAGRQARAVRKADRARRQRGRSADRGARRVRQAGRRSVHGALTIRNGGARARSFARARSARCARSRPSSPIA